LFGLITKPQKKKEKRKGMKRKRGEQGRFEKREKQPVVTPEMRKMIPMLLAIAVAASAVAPLAACALHFQSEPCAPESTRTVSPTWLRNCGLDLNEWKHALGLPLSDPCYHALVSSKSKRLKFEGIFPFFFFFPILPWRGKVPFFNHLTSS